MTNISNGGQFSIGQLPDGRFIAAATSEPYFCLRAESEDAVVAKLKAALTFHRYCSGDDAQGVSVSPPMASAQVTALWPTRHGNTNRVLEAA